MHSALLTLLDLSPAVALLETSSRFLLTLGVGLFIAYAICMLIANVFGVVYRYTTAVTNRSTPRVPETAGSASLKQEIS